MILQPLAELGPMVEGKPDVTRISTIDLEDLARKYRMQKIILETARDVFDQKKPGWKGSNEYLLPLTSYSSGKLTESPEYISNDEITDGNLKICVEDWQFLRLNPQFMTEPMSGISKRNVVLEVKNSQSHNQKRQIKHRIWRLRI